MKSSRAFPVVVTILPWLFASVVPGRAAEADVLTAHRVASLRTVTSAAVAPDGSRIAFTLSVPRLPLVDDDGEPWSELWVTDLRGATPRPFVTGKVNVSAVQWTPDSQQVAFLAKRGEDKFKALYVIPIDGGEARKAAELMSDIGGFSLAPDGKRVALVATEPEADAKKKVQDKGFKQEVYEEDGRRARVWLSTLFEKSTNAPLAIEGHVLQALWSPVDDRLLVAMTPTPGVDDSMMRQQVQVVDGTTGSVVARVERAGKLGEIAWSPDGRRVGLIGAADIHDPQAGRLLVAEASGGPARDVLPGLEGHVTHLEWAGAETLMYIADLGVRTILGRVEVAVGGHEPRPVLGPEGPIFTGLSLSLSGREAALIASSPSSPAELFTWVEGESAAVRRTDHNPDLAKLRWAKQEVVRHKARDDLELEGLLVHPLEEKEGQRYPLILAVHGGPESHVSDGWLTTYSLPGQVAAARGFAVFYPNYRGSTGRGVAFSKLGQGDAAGKEFDDLIDAVDHLVNRGLVDRAKVGITGGSYGGYATAWCSTRYSDRFAAGVMFVGISDKVSKVGTTDIPDEEYNVHALKRPWEDWSYLLERSPIFHAGRARTPLLILHGKEDPRVNPGQSRELYRHLKLRSQAPVRLVLYPGEQHGNRKAAARLDYNLRMMQWMEHYLKGPGGAMPAYELDYREQ